MPQQLGPSNGGSDMVLVETTSDPTTSPDVDSLSSDDLEEEQSLTPKRKSPTQLLYFLEDRPAIHAQLKQLDITVVETELNYSPAAAKVVQEFQYFCDFVSKNLQLDHFTIWIFGDYFDLQDLADGKGPASYLIALKTLNVAKSFTVEGEFKDLWWATDKDEFKNLWGATEEEENERLKNLYFPRIREFLVPHSLTDAHDQVEDEGEESEESHFDGSEKAESNAQSIL